MGMSAMRISTRDRRDRLWLINAFVVVLRTLLGAAGEALGYDRHLKSNTAKRRTHSVFRQGCMLYELIPNRQCWTATKESYLGRVPKALVLDAVRDGAGAGVAGRIAGSKKEIMVADAAALLDGKGWLPAVRYRAYRSVFHEQDAVSVIVKYCRSQRATQSARGSQNPP